jgi:hypothetical protein
MSRVPGFSDIVVNTKKPGKISVVFRTISKFASGHGEPERKVVGLRAAVVGHVRRQAGGALNKRERRGSIEIGGLFGGIDLDGRVDSHEMVQTGRVITMAVRDHNRVEPSQIDVELIDVVLENLRVVSGVEQNAPALYSISAANPQSIFSDEGGPKAS